ncbi:hypothetical protein BOO71_0013834 [Deinococcus marmoris]|uniref:Uncharacterized protein n=1 Tax=Deinococcus marmoris TaxID=249408 RepID=A0A1U7NS41_9DEIO|nr:hypothetical protein BOO71_0013834 [Deinococcus marmoris]
MVAEWGAGRPGVPDTMGDVGRDSLPVAFRHFGLQTAQSCPLPHSTA